MGELDERHRGVYHAAGHAVAAALRGVGCVGAARLSLASQGVAGPDWGTAPAGVLPFIAYAGAWAQARAGWVEAGHSGTNAGGRSFEEHVADTLLTHPVDAMAVALAEYEVASLLRDSGADEQDCWGWIRGASFAWSGDLEEVWPVVDAVACRLLAGESVSIAHVRAATDDRLAARYC